MDTRRGGHAKKLALSSLGLRLSVPDFGSISLDLSPLSPPRGLAVGMTSSSVGALFWSIFGRGGLDGCVQASGMEGARGGRERAGRRSHDRWKKGVSRDMWNETLKFSQLTLEDEALSF